MKTNKELALQRKSKADQNLKTFTELLNHELEKEISIKNKTKNWHDMQRKAEKDASSAKPGSPDHERLSKFAQYCNNQKIDMTRQYQEVTTKVDELLIKKTLAVAEQLAATDHYNSSRS